MSCNIHNLLAQKACKQITENNPLSELKFSADPTVLVYKDTVYVYATNDSQQATYTQFSEDNRYNKIDSLNIYSSKDLVNWTDCGSINVAAEAKWTKNSWAPAVCKKTINGTDLFFIYFADSGNGIGVLSSTSPTGPFTDPIGKPLVSRSSPLSQGVYWLFDPAVLVDDDGSAYLYYGGGLDKDYVHPKSARCAKLGSDMVSIDGEPQIIDAPYLFEDSGINKFGDTYYYTYCSNFNDRAEDDKNAPPIGTICYMTSKNPLGPFEYGSFTLPNPMTTFGVRGNNHHWIFEFKGKTYIAYHAQTTEQRLGFDKGGYRALFINEFIVNKDGTLPLQNCDFKGIDQVVSFNPYENHGGATMHSSRNIVINDDLSVSVAQGADKGWICIKGVSFDKGATAFNCNTVAKNNNDYIELKLDDPENGEILCVNVLDNNLETVVAESKNRNLYLILHGSVTLKDWSFN